MKLYITIIKVLFIGALFIISNENLALSEQENVSRFFDGFYAWVGNLFGQSVQIAGYVVNSEWLPKENTTSFPLGT